MKTAISIPDPLFDRVEHHASRLGLSRSEFFARAAARWADEMEGTELTAAIDRALDLAGDDDDASEFLLAAAAHTGPDR